MQRISGLVHTDASARKGGNWEGEKVIEVKEIYSANNQHVSTTVFVLSMSAARELLIELTYLIGDYDG